MNERIKELALHAGFAHEPVKDQLWVSGPTEIMISPGLEKFAELIVRECADIAKYHVMNISTYADAEFVEEQIREHFGVEE